MRVAFVGLHVDMWFVITWCTQQKLFKGSWGHSQPQPEHTADRERFTGLNIHSFSTIKVFTEMLLCSLGHKCSLFSTIKREALIFTENFHSTPENPWKTQMFSPGNLSSMVYIMDEYFAGVRGHMFVFSLMVSHLICGQTNYYITVSLYLPFMLCAMLAVKFPYFVPLHHTVMLLLSG